LKSSDPKVIISYVKIGAPAGLPALERGYTPFFFYIQVIKKNLLSKNGIVKARISQQQQNLFASWSICVVRAWANMKRMF